MTPQKLLGITFFLAGLGLIAWLGVIGWAGTTGWLRYFATGSQANSALKIDTSPTPGWQAEPVVPTALPLDAQLQKPTVSLGAISQSVPEVHTFAASLAIPNALERFGLGVPYPPLEPDMAKELGVGWYLSWRVDKNPPKIPGVAFWQMIRVQEDGFRPDKSAIRQAAKANPGSTWLIGNEPDVIWQDNVTPASYAQWYHELYQLLKESDPTCRVAIGGVTQPTPLRLQYLELVLASYRERYGEDMPVDVWNIHNFILREERNSWGVDIPPGLTVDQGILFELDDHDDLAIFKAQIIAFRQWLADRGQRDKPLIVSEYGILMPEDYGFGPERVQTFLYETYKFMLTATDEQLGYPADDNRLVQRWAWYSLSDDAYPTGNFVDFKTGQLTQLGQAHRVFMTHVLE
jgi:hypothetical protein